MSNTEELRPSTIEGIKRLADRLHGHGTRATALIDAARQAGYQNYAHARQQIERAERRATAAAAQRQTAAASRRAYQLSTRTDWSETIGSVVGSSRPSSSSWRGLGAIIGVLSAFMGSGRNHGYFPSGGGHDFTAVRPSAERGCIDLMVGERIAYVAKPRELRLERIESDAAESFLLLELQELAPSGVYESDEEDDNEALSGRRLRQDEELVDLGDAHYVEREAWDRGFVDDEDEPLPLAARLAHRLFRGQIMIVCKASIWNRTSRTYSGMHNGMSAQTIRQTIERAMEPREEVV